MKKSIKSILCVILVFAFLVGINYWPEQVQAEGVSDETMEGAIPLELDVSANCTFSSKSNEAHYFKFTVPQDIGNQWITFTATNYADIDINMYLLDSQGAVLAKKNDYISPQKSGSIETRIEGANTKDDKIIRLTSGNTYYIKVQVKAYAAHGINGNVRVGISGIKDDNWGTYEEAGELKVNKWQNAKLEKSDDIDCFVVTLPKDNRQYAFYVTSNNEISVKIEKGDRTPLESSSVGGNNNSTFTSRSVSGNGQKVYIRIQAGNNVTTADYSLKVSAQKQTISKLILNNYKRNSKKIVGTTIGGAAVTVKVNQTKYPAVTSNESGKFTVNLKKKLKSKDKIKVSVSKTEYKKLTKTFEVK